MKSTGLRSLHNPPPVFHPAVSSNDGVALSETAQAKLLEQQGLSVVEIADELGITTSLVLDELGVAVTTSQPDDTATTVVPGGSGQ